jgi:hypothetical protein
VSTFDYLRQERIQRFLRDSEKSDRFKAILSDGCILIYDLLVVGHATRTGKSTKSVKKKFQRLKPFAGEALAAREMTPIRKLILALADVRNAADHEPLTDDDIREQFIAAFRSVRGNDTPPQGFDANFARTLFAWIAFEIGRWEIGLPPGYIRKK